MPVLALFVSNTSSELFYVIMSHVITLFRALQKKLKKKNGGWEDGFNRAY